jgi:acyl carrier protein
MSRAYHVQGPLDLQALGEALTRVVGRQEALRTTFIGVDGRAFQVINPARRVQPEFIDLSGTPTARPFADACEVAVTEAARPFDLASGPLLRCFVVRVHPDEHLLLIGMHHIVADGWSLIVLARELTKAYSDALAGRPATAATPAPQFGDAAEWEADWFGTETFASHLAYWRDLLTGAPQTVLIGADRPRRDPPTFESAQVIARIGPDTVQVLRKLAQSERATLFMPALAAFVLLLGRYARSDDVVVGVPVAGRQRREFEDAIGLFVNTLALRCDLAGGPTFRDLLRRVRDVLLDAFAHQEVPFARIVEELNPERDLTHRPLVQVLFQYLGGFGQGAKGGGDQPSFEGTTVTTIDLPNRYTELDMEVQLIDADGGLDLLWIYSKDLYDGSTITAIADQFVGLLEAVAAEPDQSIADFDVLTMQERQRFAELEATGPQMRVVDSNLQRCPFGVPGELVIAGPDLAAALTRPSETAIRFVPDPFAAESGSRMYTTGGNAKFRRDGIIEIHRPSPPSAASSDEVQVTVNDMPGRPSSDTERTLAAIWADLLEVDQVGIDDNFFDLGGHSILAIRAIVALSEKFDCELPLRAIFDAPTVASMSELINSGYKPDHTA